MLPLCAVGYVGLTVQAGVSRFASAGVAVDVVGAGASVLAGGALTFVDLDGASRACKSGQAGAIEGINTVHTGAATQTQICGCTGGVCVHDMVCVASANIVN